VEFALAGGVSQTMDLTSRTVEALGVTNLTDSSGEGVWGAVIDPSPAPAVPPPPAPSLPRAAAIGLDTIQWAWQDNSTTETGFRIYCGPGTTAPSVSCFTTAADATQWTATGLTAGTQYAFQVSAYSVEGGESPKTATISAWTLAATPTAPAITGATATTLDVRVAPGDGNPIATEYAIYCATSGNWVLANGSLAAAWGTVTVTGLAPDTLYSFRVEARNGAGVETALGPAADGRTLKSAPPTLPEAAARDRWVLYD
jgi:chitin-binding protein